MRLRSTFLVAMSVCALRAAPRDAAPPSVDRRVVDRRVVDVVQAGDAQSEAAHGYAGHDASSGVARGRPFRVARGWMRYALATFDDTDVTLECTFIDDGRATDNAPRRYDVIVEDSVVATRTFVSVSTPSADSSASRVEIRVPFSVTKGRTNIAITIRGHDGPTPMLHVLRVLQDHNEVDHQPSFPTAR